MVEYSYIFSFNVLRGRISAGGDIVRAWRDRLFVEK